MKKNKGMTLIEVILVVGIIAVALGLGGLSLSPLWNTNIDAYAADIGSLITEARFKHMAYADTYYVEIKYDSASGDYSVDMHKEYIKEAVTVNEVIKSIKVSKGCMLKFKEYSKTEIQEIKDLPDDKLIITFKGSGAIYQNGGIIYVSKNSDTKIKQVEINVLTGKVVVSNGK
ncbi:MAG: hypothetical protein K0R15_78 [Clostridiales bacterium]|jgi:prepilin-type N-terminal cleavage/methylation domain-containing protein|nr:hypothetical protein [Clostridiales bacterium]